MLNISSLINNSHQNSSFGKFGCFEEDSNTIEAGNQNNSMFISYVSGEMKEQTLDKSMNFQIENEFNIKDAFSNLPGKETDIEPIDERKDDDDDDANRSFYHDNKNFIDGFEQKKLDLFNDINLNNNNVNNTMINNSTSIEGMFNNHYFLDDYDKFRIKKNLKCLKSKNTLFFNSINSITKENLNNNKSVLTDNKKLLFNVTKQSEDFITNNIKLNRSSCQLSYESKKSKRGRKQILLSGVKTEIMDKSCLREFKKFLKLKKKEFKNIFEEDVFWYEFIESKTPPFLFTQGGKKLEFKAYNKKLMNFIFSRPAANTLYTKFVSEIKDVKTDKIFAKKKIKKNPDYYTKAFYKFYRENLNKLYSQEYSDIDINVDDSDLNNISMDLVSNSFQ